MRTSVETKRGCGWRQPGGLYLVSGQLSEPCPRLPVEMTVCSCCGQGIRPARGFTWVDGGKLIPPTEHGTPGHSQVCPLAPKQLRETDSPDAETRPGDYMYGGGGELVSRLGDRTGLIWIGEAHYKTAREFMQEAARMGVSRRITAVPRDFKVGETWVLLGHRKAVLTGYLGDDGEQYTVEQYLSREMPYQENGGPEAIFSPGIVTAFKPTAIEYIVKGDETDEELEALEKRGIEPVKVVRAEQQSMEAM